MGSDAPLEYLDSGGKLVLSAKAASYSACKIAGPGGETVAIVEKKGAGPAVSDMTITCAKGVDPLIAMVMGQELFALAA